MQHTRLKPRSIWLFPLGIAGLTCALGGYAALQPDAALADVNAFTLRQPLNNATVRETVPIRVPPVLLKQAAYASISVDGEFRDGAAVPQSGDVVYEWDTKHATLPASSEGTSGAPAAKGNLPEVADGRHVIQVSLFDKDSNEIASATSTVRVLNRITTLPDGVRLVYKLRPDEVLTYRLHSVLKNSTGDSAGADADSGGGDTTDSSGSSAGATIQDVYAKLQRSVEDVGVAGILLRDHYTGGTYGATPLTQAFTLTSKYITINKSGSVLSETQLPGIGKHYGYGVDEFPDRRVNAGDSWQTQMMIALPWAAEKMTSVRGQARLDEFEWQDGYPTAKIVETYTGPATFHLDSGGQNASFGASGPMGYPGGGLPGQMSDQGSAGAVSADTGNVQVSSVNIRRTIWFAYESGVVVREETTLTTTSASVAGVLSSLSSPSQSSAPEAGGMGSPYSGSPYLRRRGMGGPGMGAPGGLPMGNPMGGYEPGVNAPSPGAPPYTGGAPGGYSPYGGPTTSATPTSVESDKMLTLLQVS